MPAVCPAVDEETPLQWILLMLELNLHQNSMRDERSMYYCRDELTDCLCFQRW